MAKSLESLGQALFRIRKARGISQAEVAKRAKMSQATYSQYEDDKIVDAPLSKVKALAAALEVSVIDVLGEGAKEIPKRDVSEHELRLEAARLLLSTDGDTLAIVLRALRRPLGGGSASNDSKSSAG